MKIFDVTQLKHILTTAAKELREYHSSVFDKDVKDQKAFLGVRDDLSLQEKFLIQSENDHNIFSEIDALGYLLAHPEMSRPLIKDFQERFPPIPPFPMTNPAMEVDYLLASGKKGTMLKPKRRRHISYESKYLKLLKSQLTRQYHAKGVSDIEIATEFTIKKRAKNKVVDFELLTEAHKEHALQVKKRRE